MHLLFRIIFILTLIALVVSSCNNRHAKDIEHANVMVDSLINLSKNYSNTPLDSAIIFGQKAWSIAEAIGYERGLVNAGSALADAYDKQGEKENSRDIAEHVLKTAKDNGSSDLLGKAHNTMARVYQNMRLYDLAFEEYNKAIQHLKASENQADLALAYNNLGRMYQEKGDTEQAIEYYTKCGNIARENDNEKLALIIMINMAGIYKDQGKHDKAMQEYLAALELNKRVNIKRAYGPVYINLASIYTTADDLENAKLYLDKALEFAKETGSINFKEICLTKAGKYHYYKGEYKEAIKILENALSETIGTKQHLYKTEIAETLTFCYEELNNFEKAFYYQKIFNAYNDSLFSINNTQKLAELESKYNYEKILREEELRQQKKDLLMLSVSLGLLLVLLIAFVTIRRQKTLGKLILLEKEKLEKDLDYRKQKLLSAQLEKEALEKDLDYKRMELINKELRLSEKREIQTKTIEKLNEFNSKLDKSKSGELRPIISEFQADLKAAAWEEFEIRFQDLHNDFYDKLNEKFPELTPNDKRLCAFLRLNMTTKEICSITHQKPESVDTARTRLRKKLQLTNTDINLNSFLHSI